MMPHIERSIFQWNWANYPEGRNDEVSLTPKSVTSYGWRLLIMLLIAWN